MVIVPRVFRHCFRKKIITPNGLTQFFLACPSLDTVALAIDTPGFAKLPPLLASVGSTLGPHPFSIVVVGK